LFFSVETGHNARCGNRHDRLIYPIKKNRTIMENIPRAENRAFGADGEDWEELPNASGFI